MWRSVHDVSGQLVTSMDEAPLFLAAGPCARRRAGPAPCACDLVGWGFHLCNPRHRSPRSPVQAALSQVSEQLATLRGRAERDVRSHGSGDARNLVANLGVPGSGTVRSLARGSSFRTRSSVAAGDSRKSMKVHLGWGVDVGSC